MTELEKEINRRRTFAIISHPDAGKTTLTEKLLLYGGAISKPTLSTGLSVRARILKAYMIVLQSTLSVFPPTETASRQTQLKLT